MSPVLIRQMNRVNSRNDLRHDDIDNTMNVVVVIIIITKISHSGRPKLRHIHGNRIGTAGSCHGGGPFIRIP